MLLKTKNSSSPKWHRVYYLLAAFDVVIVLLTLVLNYQILHIYERSAKTSQQWTERRNDMDELGKLAGAVNAPGNNVFDSHDVAAESATMASALQIFKQDLRHSRTEFLRQIYQQDQALEFSQVEVAVLQVAEPAVDEARGLARGLAREVAGLAQRDP